MAEVYGIEATKNAASFVADLAEGIYEVAQDGKVESGELLQVGGKLVMSAMSKLGKVTQVPQELKDLSSDEAKELVKHFEADFDLSNERAERITEKSVLIAVLLYDLGREIKGGNAA